MAPQVAHIRQQFYMCQTPRLHTNNQLPTVDPWIRREGLQPRFQPNVLVRSDEFRTRPPGMSDLYVSIANGFGAWVAGAVALWRLVVRRPS